MAIAPAPQAHSLLQEAFVMRDVIVILLWILIVLVFLPWLLRWLLAVRDNLYLKHISPRRIDDALGREDANLADEEQFNAKLAQLSAWRYDDKELAVGYFENVAPPNERAAKRLVETLIKVLPHQHRRSTQARMACLLCKVLRPQKDGKKEPARRDWSLIISAWLIEIVLVVMSWPNLIRLPMWNTALVGLAVFIVTFFPLVAIVRDRRRILQLAVAAVGIVSAGLWAFSDYAHTRILIKRHQLDAYGKIAVEISYPSWLTTDDIDSCTNKAIILSLVGNASSATRVITISLNYDHAVLLPVNKKGDAISPVFPIVATEPFAQPVEFCLRPKDRHVLSKQMTAITPHVESPISSEQAVPIKELAFDIQLEDPTWKIFREICKYGGISAPAAIGWYLYELWRKKQ